MSIWFAAPDLGELNRIHEGTAVSALGIRITAGRGFSDADREGTPNVCVGHSLRRCSRASSVRRL